MKEWKRKLLIEELWVRKMKMMTSYPLNHHEMTTLWPHYDHIMTTLWPQYDLNMTTLWPHYDHIMTTLWPHYDHIITYFQVVLEVWMNQMRCSEKLMQVMTSYLSIHLIISSSSHVNIIIRIRRRWRKFHKFLSQLLKFKHKIHQISQETHGHFENWYGCETS